MWYRTCPCPGHRSVQTHSFKLCYPDIYQQASDSKPWLVASNTPFSWRFLETGMHCSKICTVHCTGRLSCHTCPPAIHISCHACPYVTHIPSAMHASAMYTLLPHTPPYHACPLPCTNLSFMSPATHATMSCTHPLPCTPPCHVPCHTCTLPCMPSYNTCPHVTHAPPPAMHTSPGRQNDRRLWKHYLSQLLLWMVIKPSLKTIEKLPIVVWNNIFSLINSRKGHVPLCWSHGWPSQSHICLHGVPHDPFLHPPSQYPSNILHGSSLAQLHVWSHDIPHNPSIHPP